MDKSKREAEERDVDVDVDADFELALKIAYYEWLQVLWQHVQQCKEHVQNRLFEITCPSTINFTPNHLVGESLSTRTSNIDYAKLTSFMGQAEIEPGSFFSYEVTDKEAFAKSFSRSENDEPS
ncbi:hypothetical protein Ancab_009060, partial [Ancistrocladus abbreviatus]